MLRTMESKKKYVFVLFATLVIYVLANGYRFTNTMFSGDSLSMIYQNDGAWQIALGRFVQPFLILLRGGITTPFLISFLCVFWMSLSVFLLTDFLEMEHVLSIILVTAVMVCNGTVISANATYISYADFYALALFLSIFGVWLLTKKKPGFIAVGILSLTISLGIYQAYICVAIGLAMIYILLKTFELPDFKEIFKIAMKYVISLFCAAILYYGIWKLFQGVFHIWTANTYNGLAGVGDYSDKGIWTSVIICYQKVFSYFANPEIFATVLFRGVSLSTFWTYAIRIGNIALLTLCVCALIGLNRKSRTIWWHRAIQGLILALFPFGINFVCFISKGMEHALMIYAFCLVYILILKVTEKYSSVVLKGRCLLHRENSFWIATLVVLLFISWSNIVYANQVYVKKDLQEKATQSLMTRIVYSVEATEGYIAGETPVAFWGSIANSDYVSDMEGFQNIMPFGMGKSSLTYYGTEYKFIQYILNVDMNFTRIESDNKAVLMMPNYPANGSIAFVDGVLVVKLSD